MDFIDWRKASEEGIKDTASARSPEKARRGKNYRDYVEELIHEAEARGDFEHLPGMGKPLSLDTYAPAGDKELGYHVLKSNGYLPPEIELIKEVDADRERAEARLARLKHQSKMLHARRFPPSEHEKRAFNALIARAAAEYEQALQVLNSKILTINISTPTQFHRPSLLIEQLVAQFRQACPPFTV